MRAPRVSLSPKKMTLNTTFTRDYEVTQRGSTTQLLFTDQMYTSQLTAMTAEAAPGGSCLG